MLVRSFHVQGAGYRTGEGTSSVSYMDSLYGDIRRRTRYGRGHHNMNCVIRYDSVDHQNSTATDHHLTDHQEVSYNQERPRITSNIETQDTGTLTVRTHAAPIWSPHTRTTRTQVNQTLGPHTQTTGTQATQTLDPHTLTTRTQETQTSDPQTLTTGTEATLTCSTGTQTTFTTTTATQTAKDKRNKFGTICSFSVKFISGFLLLLLLAFGFTHMHMQMKELQHEVQLLRQRMNMLVPLADTIPNFALESQGAKVWNSLSSDMYYPGDYIGKLWDRIYDWWYSSITQPRVIQGHSSLQSRQCWSFSGDKGHLFISLSHAVAITHVTYSHITKSEYPHSDISNAPREFSIYGMRTIDDEGTYLGMLVYNQDGAAFQTLEVMNPDKGAFHYVKLQIDNNWGNVDHTCLYSFRVHGEVHT